MWFRLSTLVWLVSIDGEWLKRLLWCARGVLCPLNDCCSAWSELELRVRSRISPQYFSDIRSMSEVRGGCDLGGPGGIGMLLLDNGSKSELMLQQRDFWLITSSWSPSKHWQMDQDNQLVVNIMGRGGRRWIMGEFWELTELPKSSRVIRRKCALSSQYKKGFQKLLLIAVQVTKNSRTGGT